MDNKKRKEIPGFYYDEQKRKYFRLMDNNRTYDGNRVPSTSNSTASSSSSSSEPNTASSSKSQQNNASSLPVQFMNLLNYQQLQLKPSTNKYLTSDHLLSARYDQLRAFSKRTSAADYRMTIVSWPDEEQSSRARLSTSKWLVAHPSQNIVFVGWDGNPKLKAMIFDKKSATDSDEGAGPAAEQFESQVFDIYNKLPVDFAFKPICADTTRLFVLYNSATTTGSQGNILTMDFEANLRSGARAKMHIENMIQYTDEVRCFAIEHSSDPSRGLEKLAVGFTDSRIDIFDLDSHQNYQIFKFHRKWIPTCMRFSPSSNQLIVGTQDGCFLQLDSRSRGFDCLLKTDRSCVCSMQFFDEHKLIYSGFRDTLRLLDLRFVKDSTTTPVLDFAGYVNSSRKLGFSLDGWSRTLLSLNDDRLLRIWSLDTCQLLTEWNPANQIEYSGSSWKLKNAGSSVLMSACHSSEWNCWNKKDRPLVIGSYLNNFLFIK